MIRDTAAYGHALFEHPRDKNVAKLNQSDDAENESGIGQDPVPRKNQMNGHVAIGFQEDLLHLARLRVPLVDWRRETGVYVASSRRTRNATARFRRATATSAFGTSAAAILRPPFSLNVVVVLPTTRIRGNRNECCC